MHRKTAPAHPPVHPHSPAIHVVYVGLTMVLFSLLSFLAIMGLFAAIGSPASSESYLFCKSLWAAPIVGVGTGYSIGQRWWRWIYIEGRYCSKWGKRL